MRQLLYKDPEEAKRLAEWRGGARQYLDDEQREMGRGDREG